MKRRAQLYFALALLAQAVYADVELEIAPPEPSWLMPSLICRSSSISQPVCVDSRVDSAEFLSYGVPMQIHPEGIPIPAEQQILLDIRPLVAAGDHAAVLARIGIDYGPELALLEAGDGEGFLGTRTPTDGRLQPVPAFGIQRSDAPSIELFNERSARPSGGSAFAGRLGPQPGPKLISASLLYVIGHSYFSLARYVPAETAFKLALTALPNHVRAHESLGMLYLRTERYADARVHLARALQLGRNTAHVHAAFGYLEQKSRRYWTAASAFQKALVLEPDNSATKRGLLHALTETREHAKARVLVEQLLRGEPDDPDLWLYRAHIALAAGERASALASLETALRLGADSVANAQACAALHIESGNIARAVELLQDSSARGLDFALVDQALGWLANEGRWDDFRNLLASIDRTALAGVEQSRLLTRRAALALRDGDRRAAGAALQDALALDPSNPDALLALGQIYRAERDYGRADLFLQRASAYGIARDDAMIARAQVAIDQENFADALTILRNLVAGNPARAELQRNAEVLEDVVLLRTQP